MNQHDQMLREALRSFIEAMDLCGGYPDTSTDRERFDEAKRKAEQTLAAERAPLVGLEEYELIGMMYDTNALPECAPTQKELIEFANAIMDAMIKKNGG